MNTSSRAVLASLVCLPICIARLPVFCVLAFFLKSAVWAVSITPLTPLPGAQNLTEPPEVTVLVQGTTAPNSVLHFYRRVTLPATRPDFMVAVLPDTQFYTGRYNESQPMNRPEIFYNQVDWIVANRESRNIVFTAQTGDIVLNSGTVQSEWDVANNAMSRLEDPVTTMLPYGMPYSMAAAAHESAGNYVYYDANFGVSRFQGRPYYGGNFGTSNTNSYSFFSAGGMDFIVLSLQEGASNYPGRMAWANEVISANSNRRAIIVSHNLLFPSGSWTPQGLGIYEALKGNPNVFLMLCGHDPQAARRTDVYNGSSITTILADYENEPNGGNGWMRLLKFMPASNQIQVQTYSPWLNQYNGGFIHQFVIPYNMALNTSYSLVKSVYVSGDGVVSGGVWRDLTSSTSYDWYAVLQEGGRETSTSPMTFGTAANYSAGSESAQILGPAFSDPLPLEDVFFTNDGFPVVLWKAKGGRRYRVEFRDRPESAYTPIIRSEIVETDSSLAGADSYQVFVDDGSLTGGVSASRTYQVREMAPVKPLEFIMISKPSGGNPVIIWHSVGGHRYRVEVSDTLLAFQDVIRPESSERDSAPEGAASYQIFVDDGSLTGGSSPSRFYRVRELP